MFIISREPVEAVGDELAERHEMVLVVAVEAARQRARGGGDADRRVGVAVLGVAHRNAEDRRPAGNAEALEHGLATTSRRARSKQDRDHRLRADDEIAARRLDLRCRQRRAPAARWPTSNFSSCGTLPCSSETRERARRRREVDPAEQRAGNERDDERAAGSEPPARAAQVGEAEAGGERRGDRADAVDAEPRRESGKRRVDVRIAARDPRKAGEEDAARELGEQPRGARRGARRARASAGRQRARRAPSPRRGRARGTPPPRAPRALPATRTGRRSDAC